MAQRRAIFRTVTPQHIVKLRRPLYQADRIEVREFLDNDDLPGVYHVQWMGERHNGYWRFVFSDARTAMMFHLRFG